MNPSDATVRLGRKLALSCALLLISCVLAARPFAEVGINDDFSYIRSAKTLAQTGHIAFYGWSSAMLGAQLALGALFIKIFGFSFTVTRFSVLLIAACTAFFLQRVSIRLGLNEANATFAALALVLSPLFVPLSFSFMTDITALFAILLSLHGCLRALQTESRRQTISWLLFAALSSTLLGTARQTGWLGVLVLVPCTAWLLRHRKLPWFPLLTAWLACLAFLFACLSWFAHQLYTTRESIPQAGITHNHTIEVEAATLRVLLNLAFFLLPVLVAFLLPLLRQNRWRVGLVGLATLIFASLLLLRPYSYAVQVLLAPSSAMGSYVTPRGLLDIPEIGDRPLVLTQPIRTALTILIFAATLSLLIFLVRTPRSTGSNPTSSISWSQIALLLAPATCAYSLFLAIRIASDALFDRYLLPLIVFALILVVRFYQERISPRLPLPCYIALVLYAAFSIASTHDLFAMERARLAAAAELRAANLPRTAFYAGFGYDGWTQIDAAGYVAAGGITLPPSAPPYNEGLERFRPCGYTLAHYFPAIQAQYALAYDEFSCGDHSPFPPVPYRTWLPPSTSAISIRTLPQ